MTRRSHRTKLTAIALVALACALAGCGRKGGLDLPPGAAALQQEQSPQEDVSAVPAAAAMGNVYTSNPTGNGQAPVAPRGQKKRIILDGLLD